MGARQAKPTLQERMRLIKREINKSIRELDRERTRLEREEKELATSIRKAAELGDMNTTRLLAKDLARMKQHRTKFFQMRSQLQSVSFKLQSVKSTHAMSESLKSIPKFMAEMNKTMNISKLREIMKQLMIESEKLGLTQDLMEDTIDAVVNPEVDEDEIEEQIVNKVLEEIGVDISTSLLAAPGPEPTKLTAATPAHKKEKVLEEATEESVSELEKSLEERLKNLKE